MEPITVELPDGSRKPATYLEGLLNKADKIAERVKERLEVMWQTLPDFERAAISRWIRKVYGKGKEVLYRRYVCVLLRYAASHTAIGYTIESLIELIIGQKTARGILLRA